jgi:hypothetical protein
VTWWAWVLVWAVLIGIAGTVFFRILTSLWHKGLALAHELGDAAERLSAITTQLETLTDPTRAADPAIFANPTELRRERHLTRRGAGRSFPGRTPRREPRT